MKLHSLLAFTLVYFFLVTSSKFPSVVGDDVGSVISASLFEQLLKHRNDPACEGKGLFTYNAFCTAARSFGGFGTTGDFNTRKRELAAFLAQTSHETTELGTISKVEKMVGSNTATEFHYHVRSISLPSRLHPSLPKIEKELKRLKTWEASSHSQTGAINAGLTGLAELYHCVEELVGCSLTQQALLRNEGKHVEKALDMSLSLLDTCGLARELLSSMKEHVLDLQSALRRKGVDSSVNSLICAYICFRKRARKDITKRLKSLKTMESNFKLCSYPLLDLDHHLLMVINVLREISKITISFFRKLLLFLCAPVLKKNTSGWSLFTRIVSTRDETEKRVINEMEDIDIILCSFHRHFRKIDAMSDVQIVKRRLGELEGTIRELEVGLDGLFRCLIQQRVSLLNLLTP